MGVSKVKFYRPACVLNANGPDARDFLQGQFSNDLSRAKFGDGVYGLWLNRKGKIVADSFALCRGEESFLIFSYFCEESTIYNRLDEYLVMDEVELEGQAAESWGISVWGTFGRTALESLGLDLPDDGSWVGNEEVSAFWGVRGAEKSLELVFHGSSSESNFEKIRELSKVALCEELSDADLARMAVAGKMPRVGIEIGEDDLPQEVSLVESAVSFQKGCYLGQEVMARIHAMGKVRKRLELVESEKSIEASSLPVELFDQSGKKSGSLRALEKIGDRHLGIAIVSITAVFPLCIEIGDTNISLKSVS